MKMFALLNILFFSISVLAMNGKTTYQAKIIKPDGYPLEATSVNFRFTVLDTSGSCALYVEDYVAVNMSGSGGLISFALGSGTRSFPVSGTSMTFRNIFENVGPFPCRASNLTVGSYGPGVDDARKIVMQFQDSSGWQTLPAMSINAVPYAMYAHKSNSSLDSQQLNGKTDAAFVEYSTLASLSCAADQAIKFNGVSFSCITVPAGGSSGITSVTTSGTVLSTGGTASAPVISIQAATLSQDGYLTSLDYAEFKAKLSASSTQIVNTLGYAPVSGAAVATQIDAAATTSATASSIVKRDSSGNATFNDVYANAAKINYVDIYKPGTSFNIRLQAPTSLAANYTLILPTTSGTTGQVLSTDASGNLSWINPSTGSVVSVSATAPLASTGGSTPTISITQATSGTSGYLSSADFNTFNNKQAATSAAIIATLGFTPADNAASGTYAQKSNNLSDLTNASAARTNLGLGTFATASSVDLGSASATGTLAIARLPNFNGDATIAAASNTIVLSNSGVTAGTYTKVIVDAKGRVTSSAALASSDVTTALGYTPANSASGVTSLNGSVSQTQTFATTNTGTGFGITTANGVHTINIPLAASSSVVGGLLSNTDYLTFANKQTATSAAIIATLGYTPANATSATQWTTNGSNIYYNTGNIGVGILNPTAKLELASGTASVAPLKFTSGTLLSSAQSGTMEYDGFNFYLTDSTNTRRTIATGSSAGSIDNASNINSTGNITMTPVGSVIVSSTTASTNSNTGALVVKGGLGVAGNINTAGNLNVSGSSVIDGSLKLSSMTSGSVLFAGANGTLTQDNSSLFWDGANKRLGIGTTTPQEKLHVSGTMLVTGDWGAGPTLNVSGAGTRMFFYPRKAAFRAGYAYSNEWDENNIGEASFAFGDGAVASGSYSIAMGRTAQAFAPYAVALGQGQASGDYSTAFDSSVASGLYSVAMGSSSAQGDRAIAMGGSSSANGESSVAIGRAVISNSFRSVAVGSYNVGSGSLTTWVSTDPIFEIGNSQNGMPRSNAMTVLKNGNVGIGVSAPTPVARLQITPGTSSVAPIKLGLGVLLTTPQSGTIEYDGTGYYVTDNSGVRRTIATATTGGVLTNTSTVSSTSNITLWPAAANSVIVSSTVASTNSSTGALIVNGGAGIAGALNVGGTISGAATIKATGFRANQGAPDAADNSTVGYAFGPDGDTGIFSPGSGSANGILAFYGNNAERMRMTSTGFGIGTTAPDSKLQVMGTSDISAGGRSVANFTDDTALASGVGGGITLSGRYTATGVTTTFAQIWSQKENATDGNYAGSLLMGARRNGGSVGSDLTITSSGKVGIGTTSPEGKLDIQLANTTYNAAITKQSDYGDAVYLTTNATPHKAALFLRGSDKIGAGIQSGREDAGTTWKTYLAFMTNNLTGGANPVDSIQEKMRITADGNVGIGTTSPTSALSIKSSTANNTTGDGFTNLRLEYAGGYNAGDIGAGVTFAQQYVAPGTDAATIRVGGIFGVKNQATGNFGGGLAFFRQPAGAANMSEAMRIDQNGSVGIGTSAPSEKLDVSGRGRFSTTSAHVFKVTGVGSGYADATDGVATIYSENTVGSGGNILKLGSAFAPNTFIAKDNGNVGIGTTNPTVALEVSGTIKGNIPSVSYYTETVTNAAIARSTWVSSPVSVTVPMAGTYNITGMARMWCIGANDFWWKARIYNQTSGVSIVVALNGTSAASAALCKADGTVPLNRIFGGLNAGDVLVLQFFVNGTDTTAINYGGDANGGSSLNIQRVGN